MSARVLRSVGYEWDPAIDSVYTDCSDCGVLYS